MTWVMISTWTDFWPKYVERFSAARHRPSTTELHRFCCKRLAEFLGDFPLYRITDGVLDDFIAWRKKQGVSPRTINIELSVLARAMRVAIRWDIISGLPWRKMEKLPEGPMRVRFLTPETRGRLLSAAGEHRDLVLFFLSTGLRRGELQNLRWSAAAGGGLSVQIFDSKTGEGRRIPLSPLARKILLRRARFRRLGDDHVFWNPKTGKPWKDLSHILKRIFRRAGLEDWHLHDLRHAFASHLAERGASLPDLMELLGHRSPEMTRRYTHVRPERLSALLEGAAADLEDWEQLQLKKIL